METVITEYSGLFTAIVLVLGTWWKSRVDAGRVKNEEVSVKSSAMSAYDLALQSSINNVASLQKRVDTLSDDLRTLRELTANTETKLRAEIAELRAIVAAQAVQIKAMAAADIIKSAEIAELKAALAIAHSSAQDHLAAADAAKVSEQAAQHTTPDSASGASGG